MYSISQNFKNVLKNKIKILISPILYKTIDNIVDNIFNTESKTKYLELTLTLQQSVREFIKSAIISTFNEIDESYKNSEQRKLKYHINKSNVPRTLTTIVGTITFSRTYYKSKYSNNKFFYLDECFELPKYDHYDPIVKGIAIDKAINSSQAQSARDTAASISDISYYIDRTILNDIPRQSVYNWIKNWNVPEIIPESIETPETLYVMADEKYIGAQNNDKDIMVKCFVAFEGIKTVGKNRRMLIKRSVFSCYDSAAWPLFMDFIAKKYDFSKIKNIALLGDGGGWIKSGISELKLDKNNSVNFYLCQFHFKQAVHHITTDKEEREKLFDAFYTKTKNEFIEAVNLIIAQNPTRTETITKKLNYITKNYNYIKSMLELKIGSSMESHISHLIASLFSSRPKGFSVNRIKQYLKLNDYKNNGINIFKLYLQSYSNKEIVKINEEKLDYSIFENSTPSNVPILGTGKVSNTYEALHALAH